MFSQTLLKPIPVAPRRSVVHEWRAEVYEAIEQQQRRVFVFPGERVKRGVPHIVEQGRTPSKHAPISAIRLLPPRRGVFALHRASVPFVNATHRYRRGSSGPNHLHGLGSPRCAVYVDADRQFLDGTRWLVSGCAFGSVTSVSCSDGDDEYKLGLSRLARRLRHAAQVSTSSKLFIASDNVAPAA